MRFVFGDMITDSLIVFVKVSWRSKNAWFCLYLIPHQLPLQANNTITILHCMYNSIHYKLCDQFCVHLSFLKGNYRVTQCSNHPPCCPIPLNHTNLSSTFVMHRCIPKTIAWTALLKSNSSHYCFEGLEEFWYQCRILGFWVCVLVENFTRPWEIFCESVNFSNPNFLTVNCVWPAWLIS